MTPELKIKLLIEHRPWETEPDKLDWVHEPTRYKCKIRRHHYSLHLNGYVGIPYGHVWYGQNYNDTTLPEPGVHGGVTFTGRMLETKGRAVWWVGFDCGHASDMSPGVVMQLLNTKYEDTATLHLFDKYTEYRDIDYVRNQCNTLAENLYRLNEEDTVARVMLAAQIAARTGESVSSVLKQANNVRRKK
jgi:hypothetical protein